MLQRYEVNLTKSRDWEVTFNVVVVVFRQSTSRALYNLKVYGSPPDVAKVHKQVNAVEKFFGLLLRNLRLIIIRTYINLYELDKRE